MDNLDQLKQEIKRKAGIPEDKKVILYLPTWRDKTGSARRLCSDAPRHRERHSQAREYGCS